MSDRLSNNRFCRKFGLSTPLALAPMAFATGGELAAACAKAGALSLIGGAYGDTDWTEREYTKAVTALAPVPEDLARLGCGFITWKMDQDPSALDWVLDQPSQPAAIMVSFGDPAPIGRRIKDAGVPLICQIQSISQLPQAVDAAADVIVAQGGEAGGHGLNARDGRSTFTLVPEIADWLSAHAPDVLLLAAGGIADGRGLAAALMLGADGALVGSRLWASEESLAPDKAIAQAVSANGDGTARSAVFDILRQKDWPAHFDFRALRNAIHRTWEDRIEDLRADPDAAQASYREGVEQGDYSRAHVTVGEGTGLIRSNESAAVIVRQIHDEAARLLG